MQLTFPDDPFGANQAERSVWLAFRDSGALEAVLSRIGRDGTIARRERRIVDDRIAGRPVPRMPSPLADVDTLGHLLDTAERSGVDVGPVERALGALRHVRRRFSPFLNGRCHEFAMAGQARTDWPIVLAVAASPRDPSRVVARHVFLLHPDGDAVDALGKRSLGEVMTRHGISPDDMRAVSAPEIMARADLRPPRDIVEAAVAFAAVAGLDPPSAACPAPRRGVDP